MIMEITQALKGLQLFHCLPQRRTHAHTHPHTQFYFDDNWFALNRKNVLLRKCVSDLWQISEVAGQSEVKFLWVVVSDHPGEDRVLVKIVVGSTLWKKWKRKMGDVCVTNNANFVTSHMSKTSLPATVLTKMRYSKLVISLRCQRWVMFAALKSCFGVAREIRLQDRKAESTSFKGICISLIAIKVCLWITGREPSEYKRQSLVLHYTTVIQMSWNE